MIVDDTVVKVGGEGSDYEDTASEDGDQVKVAADADVKPTDMALVLDKMSAVQDMLLKMDAKSTKVEKTVSDLTASLEYSQHEIDLLKKENSELKTKLGSIDTEDKRTQFQVNVLEDKLDRLETYCKKKNLILEGVPETEGRKEDLVKTIGVVLDQLAIGDSINFKACYRVGPYNKNRVRPIMVCFERHSDRDLVYTKCMELKFTRDFQRVWVNEDMVLIQAQEGHHQAYFPRGTPAGHRLQDRQTCSTH